MFNVLVFRGGLMTSLRSSPYKRVVVAFCFSVVGLCGANIADSARERSTTSEKLIGAWQLESVETIRPNGEIIHPFYGVHPEGLLIYDRSGWMSVQIVSDPKPTVPKTDSRGEFIASPLAERVAAADGYYAYYGH